jgi:hypothetical protein
MSKHRNELLDLHYASVAGSLLAGRPQAAAAAQDAEPEAYVPRQGAVRRLVAAFRTRRGAASAAPSETS